MINDAERREVARRLRAYLDTPAPWHLVDVVSDVLRDEGDYDKIQHLADLIEPDHVGDSNKMVDRDALLKLAEDVDGAADDSGGFEPLAGMLRDIARRIREALGVEI